MAQEYDYLRAGDAVSGQEGWATMVVDGVLTELFMYSVRVGMVGDHRLIRVHYRTYFRK